MKICIDLTSLADNLSGIERYAACLSLELIKYIENEYILLFKDEVHPLFRQYAWKKNISFEVIKSCNKLIFNQIKLPFRIHKIRADWYLFLAFPVPILTFKKNMVSTIHDICCWDCPETMNGMSKWYFRISHRIAIKKCKAIMTISEFSKRRIHEKLKYPNEKIWLIYCGIDQNDFKVHPERLVSIREKYGLPDEYILSLSTLEPRKNIQLLIRAYGLLLSSNKERLPKLVLAGRKGWKMDEFLQSIDSIIKQNIIFTGFVDDDDLPDVYGNACLFVFPSLYEGFGMPPLEAMACGTPVLSSDSTSLPEVLGNAANYFKSENEESLYNELKKICNRITPNNSSVKLEEQVGKFNWKSEAEKLLTYMMDRN